MHMNMKKIVYFTLGLASCLSLLVACSKDEDFLKETPKTIYTFETAFQKPTQLDAALVKCYSDFYRLHSWGTNVWEELPAFIGGGGGSASTLLAGYGADVHDEDGSFAHAGSSFSNLAMINPTYSRFLALWNQLYELAAAANVSIRGTEELKDVSEDEKAYAVAQAKFFLGWAYLRLGECFGGVPIIREFTTDIAKYYDRESREDTYAFAIECLNAAAEGLPDTQREDGRLTKSAAYHYLAEAYLAQGVETGNAQNYTDAVTAADKVLEKHHLMTSRFGVRADAADPGKSNGVPNYRPDGNVFYDLFQIGNYNQSAGNAEAILVLQTPTYEEQFNNGGRIFNLGNATGQPYKDLVWKEEYKLPMESGAGPGPWSTNIDASQHPSGSVCAYLGGQTWGMYGSTPYVDDYVWEGKYADDMRNAEINLCHPVVLDTKHPLFGQIVTREMISEPTRLMRVSAKVKMQDEWGWDLNNQGQPYSTEYGRDWYAARCAETILFKAEAQWRSGNAAAAAETINELRRRAQCSYMLTAADLPATDGIYTILAERTRELSWEEHRWPQLLRMAKAGTENVVMHHQLLNYAMYIAEVPIYDAARGISWSLFPIPQQIIQGNDAEHPMKQNDGWN